MWGAVSFGGMSRLGVDYVMEDELNMQAYRAEAD